MDAVHWAGTTALQGEVLRLVRRDGPRSTVPIRMCCAAGVSGRNHYDEGAVLRMVPEEQANSKLPSRLRQVQVN